jgi:16S rRNA (cytidine1402-2'-O)-methyltransferase
VKLLNHLDLKKKMYSCHEFNERHRTSLLEDIARSDGAVALVSDAGTPLVSDPGYEIVRKAIQLNMQIIPVAGPSAFLLALVGSGLPCDRFVFEGFLPDKASARKQRLSQLKNEERTMVFYIAPHDLVRTAGELISHLGDREACLARELTKLHEEFLRGRLSAIKQEAEKRKVLGECVLIVATAGPEAQVRPDRDYVIKALACLLDNGEGLKDASAVIADETGWSKSELYKLGIEYLNSKRLS